MKDQTKQLLQAQARQFHITLMELTGRRATVRKSLVEAFHMLRAVLRGLRTFQQALRQVSQALDEAEQAAVREDTQLRIWLDRTDSELTAVLNSWRN